MYNLTHTLRKNTNELLWLTCVALTDQFVHDRITNERYQAAAVELEQHINGSGNLDPSGVGSVVTLKDGINHQDPASPTRIIKGSCCYGSGACSTPCSAPPMSRRRSACARQEQSRGTAPPGVAHHFAPPLPNQSRPRLHHCPSSHPNLSSPIFGHHQSGIAPPTSRHCCRHRAELDLRDSDRVVAGAW